ncbi:transcriptional regulator, winged helix family [Catenulispora acidiphila DSM 44928]|uniref:Transcriptional regulator, winged helix family n=1 Tax=Catenulispora acidiphila (strain DSM 44928 / JCM 14897 / NBRC 102108 / NRRL B-24433 / ID139908) TaxID=479433 RepID=C7QG08_CATAD|nr:BTAD domain-containing putative transcriptional regulator [Catenulispora acidiphila]ACU70985.1 transcriptional regulator, winged helix family [Catenulispora acidiphila DSM 44928]
MQIAMLGPLEVRADGGGLADVPGARLRAVLIALALRPNQVVPKASLVDWIWGENPPADAANALQRLVSRLRKALPDTAIDGLTDGYRLTVDPDAVDAVRFERLVSASQAAGQDVSERARLLREAFALWRGAAMQDVGLQDSDTFDAVVTRLEGLRLTAGEERFDAELTLGRGAELVTELTDLVAAHPTRERLVSALMRALNAAGRDSEALQVYQRTREALAEELGVDPSPELSALHVALLRGELGGKREETRKTNLRSELTSFVGREAEVAAVGELVGEQRLTTVIGPGGAGKTRLAVETARTALGGLPDGAWLVELAAIGADGDVAQAALSSLGLRDTLLGEALPFENRNAEPTDRFVAAMRERRALIVLDNCEHVIESAALFAHRVLGECRGLRILATSREPLGITGETLWPVTPLALPKEDAAPEEIAASPAVRLLRDRAQAVRRDLNVDAQQLATMARVCRALDGMPLAIELAAARLRTMSVEQLASRLDDRFRLLTGGSRIALPRHRTLRAVVDWSWELLSDDERRVLRRLSVFAGGAGLEAAEHVCAGDEIEPDLVLELLTALTEKSLLVADGMDEDATRFRMSGTIREYAAQRLAEAGEQDAARRAHLDFFTLLTETAEPRLRLREQVAWLAVLQAEHDNIAAAARGALAAGEAQSAMRLAAASGWYWWLAGYRTEGLELLLAATKVPGETTAEVRAVVYALIVMFATSGRGDEHSAEEWIHKAYEASQHTEPGTRRHPGMALVEPLERMLRAPQDALTAFEPQLDDDDPWVRALARVQTGKIRVMFGQGSLDADEHLEKALAEFTALGERFGTSLALTELADRIAVRGEFARAAELYERAVVVIAEVGAPEEVIRMRARQALMLWMAGDRDGAAAAIADGERSAERVTWPGALAELALAKVDLARWAGDAAESRRQIAVATTLLGEEAEQTHYRAMRLDMLARVTDDLEEARAHSAAALAAASEVGLPLLLAMAVVGVADLALRQEQPEQAARLLGAAAALRGLPDSAHPDVAHIETQTRNRLGDTRFAEAVLEGTRTELSELTQVTLAS